MRPGEVPTSAPGYHASGDFEEEVRRLAERAGGRSSVLVYGTSVQDRELTAVVVAGPGRSPSAERPLVAMVANLHGDEVVSSELALAVLDDATLGHPPAVAADVLKVADVLVAPCANPDGRAAALASLDRQRPWHRRGRRNARGVDLDSNWPRPHGFTDHGLPISGTRTGSSLWRGGRRPLSEPETAALAETIETRPPVALLNLHSPGQSLIRPRSSRSTMPAEADALAAMADAFRAHQGTWRYRSTTARPWSPNGSLDSWLHDRFGTLALTVEIARRRDGVREEPRRFRWMFWWANPADPAPHIANDRRAVWAALAAALRHRAGRAVDNP